MRPKSSYELFVSCLNIRILVLYLLLFASNSLSSKLITIGKNLRFGKHPKFLLDPSKRIDDYPILSVETYRAHADFILDETCWTIETDDLFDGCIIFVGLRSLDDFYYKVLPFIEKKIIIVSHGGEAFKENQMTWDKYHRSESYITPKLVANPNVLAVFLKNGISQHPNVHCIPLGKAYWFPWQSSRIKVASENLTIECFFKEKPIKIYWNFVNTHSRRKVINAYFRAKPPSWLRCNGFFYSSRKPFGTFFEDLQNSEFVLSPRGFGIDSIRTWEALYAGAIPVVETDKIDRVYEGLPVIIVRDMTKITLGQLRKKREEMKANIESFKLERLFADYWLNKIRSYAKGEDHEEEV